MSFASYVDNYLADLARVFKDGFLQDQVFYMIPTQNGYGTKPMGKIHCMI